MSPDYGSDTARADVLNSEGCGRLLADARCSDRPFMNTASGSLDRFGIAKGAPKRPAYPPAVSTTYNAGRWRRPGGVWQPTGRR